MAIFNNIKQVFGVISRSAMKAGRCPSEIKLIAVTKTVGIPEISEAIESGLRIFGENRIQEAKKKILSEELGKIGENVEWHFIGHLQKNKAKDAVSLFDLIHSVDSHELALEINKHAEKIGKLQRVLVQVKLSEEESKSGIDETALFSLLKEISGMKNIKLEGLMTVPPFYEDISRVVPFFRRLSELRDEAGKMDIILPELSMGMSHDYEAAIMEGATMVRVGTAIFGERKKI